MSEPTAKVAPEDEFAAFDVTHEINEGIKVDLNKPNGKPSGQWLMVRNYRSDAYRNALQAIQTRVGDSGTPSPEQRKEDRLSLLVSLVGGWSFKTPLTNDSAKAFLRKAILIGEQIDKKCTEDALFFGSGGTDSTSGQSKS